MDRNRVCFMQLHIGELANFLPAGSPEHWTVWLIVIKRLCTQPHCSLLKLVSIHRSIISIFSSHSLSLSHLASVVSLSLITFNSLPCSHFPTHTKRFFCLFVTWSVMRSALEQSGKSQRRVRLFCHHSMQPPTPFYHGTMFEVWVYTVDSTL